MPRERNPAGVRCEEDKIIAESTRRGLLVAAFRVGKTGIKVPGMTSPIGDLHEPDDRMLLFRAVELKDEGLFELAGEAGSERCLRLTQGGVVMARVALCLLSGSGDL